MDTEPEIGLGGANFNADPIGARELLYPIAVILTGKQRTQYEALQQKLGLTDTEILLRFHPCFTLTVYGAIGTQLRFPVTEIVIVCNNWSNNVSGQNHA